MSSSAGECPDLQRRWSLVRLLAASAVGFRTSWESGGKTAANIADRSEQPQPQPQPHCLVGVGHRDQRGEVRVRRAGGKRLQDLRPVVGRGLEVAPQLGDRIGPKAARCSRRSASSSVITRFRYRRSRLILARTSAGSNAGCPRRAVWLVHEVERDPQRCEDQNRDEQPEQGSRGPGSHSDYRHRAVVVQDGASPTHPLTRVCFQPDCLQIEP